MWIRNIAFSATHTIPVKIKSNWCLPGYKMQQDSSVRTQTSPENNYTALHFKGTVSIGTVSLHRFRTFYSHQDSWIRSKKQPIRNRQSLNEFHQVYSFQCLCRTGIVNDFPWNFHAYLATVSGIHKAFFLPEFINNFTWSMWENANPAINHCLRGLEIFLLIYQRLINARARWRTPTHSNLWVYLKMTIWKREANRKKLIHTGSKILKFLHRMIRN